jgi:hypothetical protein
MSETLEMSTMVEEDGTATTLTSTATTNIAAQEGHGEPTSKTRHIWGLSELNPSFLSPYPDAMHATRKVLEDLMLEEVQPPVRARHLCHFYDGLPPYSIGSRLNSTAT